MAATIESAPSESGDDDAPRDVDPLVGRTFDDKFLILRRIGVGGFGAVYAARDLQLGCSIAIKVLRRDAADSERNLASFLNEVRRVSRLKHPNIVDWKTLAETKDGVVYFVMELLEGDELERVLRREGALPPQRTARILLQILDALRAAHELSDGDCLLHLDLKPSNVFLERPPAGRRDHDWVKVIDFGVSQYIHRDGTRERTQEPSDETPEDRIRFRAAETDADTLELDAPNFTRCTACTPAYASPEQGARLLGMADAPELDARADLYSLGVIAFRMLTGRLPFERCGSDEKLLRRKLELDPPPVASIAPRVPRALARFVDRCLRRDRDARFASAAEAYDRLNPFVQRTARVRALVLGACAAAILLVAGWVVMPRRTLPRVDLYEARNGLEEQVTGEALFLGTARPESTLRVTGTLLHEGDQLRLVSEPTADARELIGWSVERRSESEVLVRARVNGARSREPAYLEVNGRAGRRYSQPFDAAWLGREGLQFGSIGVPRRGARAVDPDNLSLQVAVSAPQDEIERVEVEFGDRIRTAQLDPSRGDERECFFLLPLQSLAARADGPCDLRVHAIDRAGNSVRGEHRVELVSALAFGKVEMSGASRSGERYLIHDLAEAKVSFDLNGSADVELTLIEEGGNRSARRSLARTRRASVTLAELTEIDGDAPFAGRIELVAVDAPYVLRDEPSKRGRATALVSFFCNPAPPKISVLLSGGGGARLREISTDMPYFSPTREIEVHVKRENTVPIRITAFEPFDAPTPGEPALPVPSRTLVDPSDQSTTFGVSLSGAGRREVVVRAWKHLEEQDPEHAAEVEVRVSCFVDETAPRLEFLATEATQDDPAASVWPSRARIAVFDESPVHLRYELEKAPRSGGAIAAGEVLAEVLPGVGLDVELPVPGDAAAGAALADGRYLLRFLPTDEAGNEGGPIEVSLEVDRHGPALELTRPAAAPALWQSDATGSFEVRVVASDANGVAGVRASIASAGATPIEFDLGAEHPAGGSTDDAWSGRVRLPREWTRRPMTIECTARDDRGRTTTLATTREAESIELPAPARLFVERAGVRLASMRLVRGNSDAQYVLGGRSDETEEKAFAALGLGVYNRLRTPKSWEIAIAAGEIVDFYLDEREATVREFLGFLEDRSGYARAEAWPDGLAPGEPRRLQRIAELRDLPADDPIANVDWSEARAFARWSGKRLPSFVEWEFALRDGLRYRACAETRPKLSIWCATPAAWPDEGPGSTPAAYAAEHLPSFLAPWRDPRLEASHAFWVLGASARHPRADFSIADRRERERRSPEIGFRCAASLEDVLGVLETHEPDMPWFRDAAEAGR